MAMRGFDPKYRDLPDFIEKVTREIWEERGIGRRLHDVYATTIVRAANALIVGDAGVVGATLATLHEFPDRQLVYEDVIWSGNEDDGFLSSHRLISVMRKQNAGAYGPASGALVRARIIADCVVKDGAISEEWLVRDHGSFATCLGTTPEALAAELVERDLARDGGTVQFFHPRDDVPGPYVAVINDSGEARRYADAWRGIWGDKTPALIREHYHLGAAVHVPCGEVLAGHWDIDRWVISYLASFPDLQLTVDHLIVNRDPGQPVRIALRWSIHATHTGWGRFGEPSGAPLYIMGMTHAYMVDGRITHEWVTIDEVAIWKQILAHRHGARA